MAYSNNRTGRYSLGARSRAKTIGKPESFYPSPFFDVAQNYLPKTIKETFDWCLYYQLTNPLISAVTSKLATYPITDLIYEDDNEGLVEMYRSMFEGQFLLRQFLIETNLDRYTYGNAFVSVSFPFKKVLKCRNCGDANPAREVKYKWKSFAFHMTCEKCMHVGLADVKDEPIKSAQQIRLIRWNPKSITVKYNEVTGQSQYYYNMPRHMRNDIMLGKPAMIETIPQVFIESLKKKRSILLESSKLFHCRRASVSRDPSDSGWGAPLILPVLKDIFFLQILRKAQEAVAMEHVVPMRVMFPQVTTDGNNPYAHVNLQDWQDEVSGQIKKWRMDNNHIPVMPVPIGYQMIGGQGKSLLLHQELRVYNDQIIAGMGVPTGFFYGEQQYSGASVNLRALENEFLGNRQDMLRLVEFVRDRVCAFLDLPRMTLKFKPFKMADDIQRASFDMNLANAGMISRRSFLESRDFNFDTEQELIHEEGKKLNRSQREGMIANAESQGEAMLIQTRYQIQSQELQMEAQQQQQASGMAPPPGQPQQGQPQEGQPQQGPPQEGAPPEAAQQPGPEGAAPPPDQQGGGQPSPEQGAPLPEEATAGADQSPMGAANTGQMVDMFAQAKRVSSQIKKMNEVDRYRAMAQLRASSPDLYMLVNNALSGAGIKTMQPLPEKLPSRANPDRAQI
jgi:hypothetical protein